MRKGAILAADKLLYLCSILSEIHRKLSMFNMVYWYLVALGSNLSLSWPTYTLDLIISPGGMSLSTVQWDDKKELTSDITFCPWRYNCCLFSTFRWLFSLISACFVGLWKGRINLNEHENWFNLPLGSDITSNDGGQSMIS